MKKKEIDSRDDIFVISGFLLLWAIFAACDTCQAQTDSTETYCLPLWIARQEIENSSKKIEQDSLIVDLNLRLVEKHLAYRGLQEDFSIYRNNTDDIMAGYRKENAGLVTINTRLATDNERLTFVKIPLIGKVRRKDVNFGLTLGLTVTGFVLGVLVGK